MTASIQLSASVLAFLEEMRATLAPHTIELQLKTSQLPAGSFDPEEFETRHDDQGNIQIPVWNQAFADFIVVHELIHLQQERQQIVQIGFVRLEDQQLVQVLYVISQSLMNTVLHQGMHSQLKQFELFTERFNLIVQSTFEQELPAETAQSSHLQIVLTALQMMDTFTFIGQIPAWRVRYPRSFMLAERMWQLMQDAPLATNRHLRHLFLALNQTLTDYFESTELAAIDLSRDLIVTPVFSDRQLKLDVRQLFQLYHVTDSAGLYLGLGRNDQQAAFELRLPKLSDAEQQAKMMDIYQSKIGSFFEASHLPFAPRDLVIFERAGD